MNLLLYKVGLQHSYLRVVAGIQPFCCRCSVHLCPEGRTVYLVEEEVVVSLPWAVSLQFLSRDVVEVNDGHVHLLANSEDGRREVAQLALYGLAVLLVGITWCESKEHRRSTFGAHFADETSCVTAEGIDGVLLLCHLIIYNNRVFRQAQLPVRAIRGACADGVDGSVVVMSQFQENVVASLHSAERAFPQVRTFVERAW